MESDRTGCSEREKEGIGYHANIGFPRLGKEKLMRCKRTDTHARNQCSERATTCVRGILARAGSACRRPYAPIRVQPEGNMGVTRQDTH